MYVKTLHLFFVMIMVISFVIIEESNSVFAQIQPTGGPIILLFTPKSNFVDGEIIPINGHALRNSTLDISLTDNHGNVENSTKVKSNSTGYFFTSLGIPPHVMGGTWYIFATSDDNHSEIPIMVNVHGVSTIVGFPSELPPLKQFKLGIKIDDITCKSGLDLIIKAEDGSPNCVTIETGKNLVLFHDWATTFGTGMKTNDYYPECDTMYPRSDSGIPVLYMPTNFLGKICVKYYNLDNTPTDIGARIFDANNLTKNASDVTTWSSNGNILHGNENTTKVYFIKTGNKTGFYGFSLTCGGVPLAVGYDANSTFTTSDFPWVDRAFHCGVITYDSYIKSIGGIGVKHIPYP